MRQQKYNLISDCKNLQGIFLFQDVSASYAKILFVSSPKDTTFDTLFETVSQRMDK